MQRRMALGLAALLLIAGVWGVYSLWDRGQLPSMDSGDGWFLLDTNVDPAHIPGSIESIGTSAGGLGFRFVVATSTGGDADCDPPRLVGSTRTDSTLILDLQWRQRGCADAGGAAFDLAVERVPEDGLGLAFPITAERACQGAVLYPDGTVAGCGP